nr:hypothetical protein [Streptomyces sp. I6]
MRRVAGEEDTPGPVPVGDPVGEVPLAVAEQFHRRVEGEGIVDEGQRVGTGPAVAVRAHDQVVEVAAVQ